MQYFTYSWHNTSTLHVPNLTIFVILLFLKSQFTTSAQNIVLLNRCMHGHIWECTVALLCRYRGYCLWFTKGSGEVSLHLQLKLNALGFWSVPTDKKKNLHVWGWANVGWGLNVEHWRGCGHTYTNMKLPPRFGVGLCKCFWWFDSVPAAFIRLKIL
jgi:hypothetical protein